MPTPSPLDALEAEFDRWRQHKASLQARIPEDLRRKAVGLCADYSDDEIIRTLKLKPKRFADWRAEFVAGSAIPSVETVFVPLLAKPFDASSDRKPQASPAPILQVTGMHPNGLRWCLEGQFNPEQLRAIVAALSVQAGGAL